MRHRHILGVLCTLALACAGVAATAAPGGALDESGQLFNEVGTYTYEVPHNVCQVHIVAFGATGGPRYGPNTEGGDGGGIEGTFAVHPGQDLGVYVGETGETSNGNGQPPAAPAATANNTIHAGGFGYNYGGDGRGAAGGGGGSSAVTGYGNDPLIIAGGGGGGRTSDVGKYGGDGGVGAANGSAGTGNNGGAGGTVSNNPNDASPGGDAAPLNSEQAGGVGGGGAGVVGGDAGGSANNEDSPYPGGAGGGGASNVFNSLYGAYAPSSGYPSGYHGEGENIVGEDGYVVITPGDRGVGCPTSTLQVKKVVGDNSTDNGYVVHVECSHDRDYDYNPDVNAEDYGYNHSADAYLPFLSNGQPDGANAPNPSWDVVDGTWIHTFHNVSGVQCTATETDPGDATTVNYTCDWNQGDHDKFESQDFERAGCPGSSSGPSEDPAVGGTVVLEGCNDSALLTVYNDFPEPVTPEPVTPEPVTPITPVTPAPAAAPAAVVAAPNFTG